MENEKSVYGKTADVAAILGLTARRVQQLTKDGILSTIQAGRNRHYDLLTAAGEYIRYLQDREKDDPNAGLEEKRLKAEVDLKQSKAKMAELELSELEGRMHRAEDVEAMTIDLVYAIRGMITALPGRLAVDLSSITEPTEIASRLRIETDRILNDLAEYEYNPEKYRERVVKRQGWHFDDPEETDE